MRTYVLECPCGKRNLLDSKRKIRETQKTKTAKCSSCHQIKRQTLKGIVTQLKVYADKSFLRIKWFNRTK
jgi:transcription elongation factor Elf1